MSEHDFTDNHSHDAIPDSETVSGLRIALIIIGVAITLPAFLLGANVIVALGVTRGALAIFVGELIILAMALLTMAVGATSRLSTYMIVQFPFGRLGGRFVSLVLSTTLFGWFGVTLILFAQAIQQTVSEVFAIEWPLEIFTIGGSILMIATTIFGFRGIDRLTRIAVPLLAVLLSVGVYRALTGPVSAEISDAAATGVSALSSFGLAVSAVVGGFAVGATIVPDLARFAKSRADSAIGAIMSYGVGCSLVIILAGLPAQRAGTTDLIAVMTSLGLGIPALAVMVFATWTTNINSLYSASLGLAQVFPQGRDWMITSLAGLLGTILALIGILDQFVGFLLLLSAAIPPIAGIYVVDFFLVRNRSYSADALADAKLIGVPAFAAWGIAVLAATLTTRGQLTLSGIPACDAMAAAAAVYAAISLIGRK